MDFTNFGFFSYKPNTGDLYRYTAEEFSTIISGLCGDGVNAKYGDCFAATANGTEITLGSGMCWVAGHCAWNEEPAIMQVDTSGIICAHLDMTNAIIELVVVDAETATDPNYLPLYNATVSGGSVALTDVRTWNYGSANLPAAQVIYSATQPAVVNGAIWLKKI